MQKRTRESCAILIDVANISFAFNKLRLAKNMPYATKLNYNALIEAVVSMGCSIIEKSIYVGAHNGSSPSWKGFVKFFEANGFRAVSKEVKVIRAENGENLRKANFDVEIATDMCRYAWRRDCSGIILFSGDSDFAYLLSEVRDLGIRITVVSSIETLSTELRDIADRLILLDNLKLEDFTILSNTQNP